MSRSNRRFRLGFRLDPQHTREPNVTESATSDSQVNSRRLVSSDLGANPPLSPQVVKKSGAQIMASVHARKKARTAAMFDVVKFETFATS